MWRLKRVAKSLKDFVYTLKPLPILSEGVFAVWQKKLGTFPGCFSSSWLESLDLLMFPRYNQNMRTRNQFGQKGKEQSEMKRILGLILVFALAACFMLSGTASAATSKVPDLAGTYTMTNMVGEDGKEVKDELAAMKILGMAPTMVIAADGSATLNLFGEVETMRFDAKNMIMYVADEKIPFLYEDGSIIFEDEDGMSMTFTRDDGESAPAPVKVSLEAKELYNEDGIVISTTGSYEFVEGYGPRIGIRVENNTDKGYFIDADPVYVNDYLCAYGVVCDETLEDAEYMAKVRPNSSVETYLNIELGDLEQVGIRDAGVINTWLDFYDMEDDEEIAFSSDMLEIETDYEFEDPDLTDGQILFEEDDVTVVALGPASTEEDAEYGIHSAWLFYVENAGADNVYVEQGTIKVNGKEIPGTLDTGLFPYSMAVTALYFDEEDWAAAGIEELESLELSLVVGHVDLNTSDIEEAETETFTVNVK